MLSFVIGPVVIASYLGFLLHPHTPWLIFIFYFGRCWKHYYGSKSQSYTKVILRSIPPSSPPWTCFTCPLKISFLVYSSYVLYKWADTCVFSYLFFLAWRVSYSRYSFALCFFTLQSLRNHSKSVHRSCSFFFFLLMCIDLHCAMNHSIFNYSPVCKHLVVPNILHCTDSEYSSGQYRFKQRSR